MQHNLPCIYCISKGIPEVKQTKGGTQELLENSLRKVHNVHTCICSWYRATEVQQSNRFNFM